jgi:hypothetical protein
MKYPRIAVQLSKYSSMLQEITAEITYDQQVIMSTTIHPPADTARDVLALQHVIEEVLKLRDKLKSMQQEKYEKPVN